MSLRSPKEELYEFLTKLPSWRRKIVQLDVSLTPEEQLAWIQSDWWQNGGQVDDEYMRILKRIPVKWREHRKGLKRQALAGLPAGASGRPRKDALAEEAERLQHKGTSHSQIAVALNLKYGADTTTREAVRKLLFRKRRSAPDKT